jgi:hypothetical protein
MHGLTPFASNIFCQRDRNVKEQIKKEGMYKLHEDNDRIILSVVCGGIGMFIAKIVLTDEEVENYRIIGWAYIRDLAYDVAKNHTVYADRMVL